MYRLRWNWDIYLDQLSYVLDNIDKDIMIEVYIERFSIHYYEWSYFRGSDFNRLRKMKSTKKIENFRFKDEQIENIFK